VSLLFNGKAGIPEEKPSETCPGYGVGKIFNRSYKMLVRIRNCLLVFSCACAVPVTATSPLLQDYHHASWTAETGLGAVFDIQQSPDGYLWLTTTNGVYRFDGVRFQTMDEVSGGAIRNQDLDSIFVTRNGDIWLSTRAQGLIRWRNGVVTPFRDRRCTPGLKTDAIKEAPDGSLWIQSSARLAHFREGSCEPVPKAPANPSGFPAAILVDSRGTLWVKMVRDLYLLRADSSTFEHVPSGSTSRAAFTFLREAPDKSIWLSDEAGLRMVAGSNGVAVPSVNDLPTLPISRRIGNFIFVPDGTLWAATSRGVERFDGTRIIRAKGVIGAGEGAAFTPVQGLSSDVALKIIRDQEGTIWVGTSSGLDQLRENVLSSLPRPRSLAFQMAVAADSSAVWIGSRALPLSRITADGALTTFPQTGIIFALRRDFRGDIWSGGVAKQAKLWRFSGAKLTPVRYPHDNTEVPAAIAVDRMGGLWVSTFAPNIYHRTGDQWTLENDRLGRKPGVIGTMAEDGHGNVWFAFSNKVVKWDGSGFDRYSFPDGALNISVTTLTVRREHVWLAGLGGIVLFQNGSFRKLLFKDAGPGRVTGIVETPSGDLWTNGFSGVTHVPAEEIERFLQDPQHAVTGEQLDAADGLPGLPSDRFPEPSLVESPGGRLWFATSKGVVWLDPDRLTSRRNRIAPPVHITSIRGAERDYLPSNPIALPPRTRNIRIEYTALSLAIPERVRFRYKLEGSDTQWQEAGTRRQAFYTSLSPGKYRFRVTASNNDGVWNDTGASWPLSIAPAFYETLWFQTLMVLVGIGLIWPLYRLRLRQITARADLRNAERLEERTRIARELHDTLLQSFHGSMFRMQAARDLLPHHPEEAGEALDGTIARTEQAIDEGRNAIQGLRSEAATASDITQLLRAMGHELAASQQGRHDPATFRLTVEGERQALSPLLQDEVYRIAREVLANAFQHACARQIEAEIKYDSRAFRLRIRDDGTGIDPRVLKQGKRLGHWGLPGIRERAEQIGARLDVWSEAGVGTEVQLAIPASLAYFKSDSAHGFTLFRKKRNTHAL
jgi:signal transduction histidine kinase/ligand-binding sensor domain-containing protein